TAAAGYDSLYTVEWAPVPVGESPGEQSWAVIGDPAELTRAGIAATAHGSLEELLTAESVPDRVAVVLDGGSEEGLARAVADRTSEVLEIVRTWVADERFPASRLVIVTHGAVAAQAGDEVPDLVNAGIWGLVRSAQSENPDRMVLLDLDGAAESAEALTAALATGETQLALRAGTAYVPRLARSGGALAPPAGGGNWRLDVTRRGTVEDLALLPQQ